MGAFLSLPVVGYLLMPSVTSYSTSLNLLFFYMTWSTLVLSQPPLKVEVVGTLAVRALFFLLPSLIFLIFDSILPSLSVSFKTQGGQALPTRTGGVRKSRNAKTPLWYQVIGLSIFNICFGVLIQSGIELLFTEVFNIRSALKITTTLPMPWSIAKDIGKGLVLREIIQYYTHRFILHASRPNTLSALHKSYFHSITSPFSFSAHYDHPLPYLILRFLPIYLPAIIFRMHLLTYLCLLSLVTLEETMASSGYVTVPGIMLGGIARRQDMHCESGGKGNFAPWGLLDWMHSTSIGADVLDDMRDEAEKHRMGERSEGAWASAKKSGRQGAKALGKRRNARRA